MKMTAPLTTIDCDLRNFSFMPLDVVRLRDSDLAAIESAEAFRAAVLLWCASWHQIPAASLPDDDRVLASLAGYGRVVKEWQKVKAGALRGWIVCDDGRLYHPLIAEKANEAYQGKLGQAYRTECARIKKHNQRDENKTNQLAVPTLESFLSQRQSISCPEAVPRDNLKSPESVPEETASNRKGEGKGQGILKPTSQPDASARDPKKFAMHIGWQPSEEFATLAKMAMATVPDGKLGEFVAHWLTQPITQRTQAEWDKSLLQSCQHDKLRKASPISPKGKLQPDNFAGKDYGTGVNPL